MRIRIFVLIAICIVLDVLVVRQVRQYDEQKVMIAYGYRQIQETPIASSADEMNAGQVGVTQKGKASSAPC